MKLERIILIILLLTLNLKLEESFHRGEEPDKDDEKDIHPRSLEPEYDYDYEIDPYDEQYDDLSQLWYKTTTPRPKPPPGPTYANYHGIPCTRDRSCYERIPNGMICEKEKCECNKWKGIRMQYVKKRWACYGAGGHPCSHNRACASDKCIIETYFDKNHELRSRGACTTGTVLQDSFILIILSLTVLLTLNLIYKIFY